MKNWPTLFKRTSTGATQEWRIFVEPAGGDAAQVVTRHGQHGGKMQESVVQVTRGKNRGRSNETTPTQQAELEAAAKWRKQIDKGYRETLEAEVLDAARAEKPMLAQEYEKRRDKVDFSKPAFVQSKLDGIRCLAKKGQGRVTLWSRMGKPIETMPHIVSALEGLMEDGETWDGELYIHGVPFQTISSWIKRLQDDSARVQYHVYDAVAEGDFWDRFLPVHERIVNEELVCPDCPTIFAVSAWPVDSHDDLKANHDAYVKDGYEGAMLRHGGCPYEPGRRSPYLVKVKEFMEEEFEVVDVVQGRGKFEGLGILRCVTAEGVTFDATPVGTDLQRRWYFEHRDEVIGKRACIRFFEWTTSDPPVPRFPVAKGLREID